jgi:hypothetical protein
MRSFIKTLSLSIFFLHSQLFSQSAFDMLIDFASENFIEFNYSYNEFDSYAYQDSSIILNSFTGKKTVFIDSITINSNKVKYNLSI